MPMPFQMKLAVRMPIESTQGQLPCRSFSFSREKKKNKYKNSIDLLFAQELHKNLQGYVKLVSEKTKTEA